MTLQDFKDQVARDKGFRDWYHMFRTYCHPTYRTALNMHIDRAAELHAKEREKEAKPKWFKLTERKPHEKAVCLVRIKHQLTEHTVFGWWHGTIFTFDEDNGKYRVTHWMYLPEPPIPSSDLISTHL